MLPMLPSIGISIENDVGKHPKLYVLKTSFASYEKKLVRETEHCKNMLHLECFENVFASFRKDVICRTSVRCF